MINADPTPTASAPIFRPNARFLLAHPAHFIALGGGSGLAPIAPGTVGTLWAWLAFLVLDFFLTAAALGGVIAVSLVIGWWACTVTAQNMGLADSGHIVWDEVVAFWIVLWLILPAGLGLQVLAFALFRFFDAVKFGPVAWADRHFKGLGPRGGFGILFDDLVAAFCTLLVISIWTFARS
ncbi:MAG: phosphatidylglycerophosphatase A [Comamonadaceae bacterium]|jgi:phosphatidylglycerophosphatase A|nr:phosphatidylglycerophosphatase A [Comamonadaceae bacterium]